MRSAWKKESFEETKLDSRSKLMVSSLGDMNTIGKSEHYETTIQKEERIQWA